SLYLLFNFSHRSPLTLSFFFNASSTTEIYTLSLHDALPISVEKSNEPAYRQPRIGDSFLDSHVPGDNLVVGVLGSAGGDFVPRRSEEHTSELQSRGHLVCRLLLEKKKKHGVGQTWHGDDRVG